MVVPLLLAVAGVVLIIAGQLGLDAPPVSSLPPIPDPTSQVAIASPTATPAPSEDGTPDTTRTEQPTPSPTPIPDDWVAVQIDIPAVGIRVPVRHAVDDDHCDFPPSDAAYVLCGGEQPGRGNNAYIFAHALNELFKPLWNVRLGDRVKVLMSDRAVLVYVVTEVHPNVSCPDDRAAPHPSPPLALKLAPPGCEEGAAWTRPTDHERLTLQTSQGYNRNWGELIIVAEPARS
jgi:sortase (surface protein transpeptidase)